MAGGSSATWYMRPNGNGELAVGATEVQGPSRPCRAVKIKANLANTDNVYVGTATGVTVPNAATDTTTGFPLDAGQELELLTDNLDRLWFIGGAASQAISYILYT